MSDRCRSCDAEIVWARHITTHRPAPIDVPDPADPEQKFGNVLLLHNPETGDDRYMIDLEPGDETNRTTNHFATCPNAKDHR